MVDGARRRRTPGAPGARGEAERGLVPPAGDVVVHAPPERQTLDASLGARIRRRRQDKALRLVDLADLTNLSVSFISQMERGLTEPSMRSLIRIAEALGTTAHNLMEDTPPVEKRWSVTKASSTRTVPNDSGTARAMIEPNPAVAVFDFVGGPLQYFTYYRLPSASVMVVLHGRYEIDIEGELSMLEAGDAVFVGAGVEHRWRRCGGPKSRAITMIRESGAGGQGSGQPPGT